MPTYIETARWVIVILASLVLGVAAARDVSERRIPNWTVLAIAGLFAMWTLVAPSVSLLSSLGAAGIVFVVTLGFVAFNLFGAGDSKLMTAVALFAGVRLLPYFVLGTVLFGGALAVFSLALEPRRALALIQLRGRGDPSRGIPYGVAISLAGVILLLHELSCSASDPRLLCF